MFLGFAQMREPNRSCKQTSGNLHRSYLMTRNSVPYFRRRLLYLSRHGANLVARNSIASARSVQATSETPAIIPEYPLSPPPPFPEFRKHATNKTRLLRAIDSREFCIANRRITPPPTRISFLCFMALYAYQQNGSCIRWVVYTLTQSEADGKTL